MLFLGGLHLELKNYNSALFYLNSALEDFKTVNNRNWVMRVLLELAKTNRATGNIESAFNNSRELLVLAEEAGARQYVRDAHYLLYQLFDGSRNKESAYEHLLISFLPSLSDAIDMDFSARKLQFYKTSHEREQSQLKIDLLDQQRRLQEEELKQTSTKNIFCL